MRLFIFFMVLLPNLYAQQPDSFSLDQAVAYALENQVSIKNAVLDINISKAKVGEIRAIGLPHINASAQFVDNPILKRMYLEVNENNAFTAGMGRPGDIVVFENFFQLRSSGDVSATASQLIFDGSYFVGLKAAKTYNELAHRSLDKSKTDVVEAVTKAYYMVLVNRERMSLLDANIARLDTVLNQTRKMNQEGFIEKIDVDRLEVNYNNLLTEKSKSQNLFQVSKILLKYQMGMPIGDSISLSQSLSSLTFDTTFTDTSINYDARPEYRLLQTNKKLQVLNLNKERMGALPSLSAFGSLGSFSQYTSFTPLFGNSMWYPYTMFGLNLSVPILDGFGRTYRSRQAKLEIEKAQNNLADFENIINFQVQQSKFNYLNSLKSLQAQKRNLELAEEVTRISKIKYQEGVGSNLELVTAETSYKEAQTNYYNALYDVIVSKIDYEKSLGILYAE